jgi:hypothetical protein
VIATEARGASHHCARLLQSFGHSVKSATRISPWNGLCARSLIPVAPRRAF